MMELLNKQTSPGAELLMDTVLRDGESIRSEYPLVFEDQFSGSVVSLEEDGVTCSSCSLLTRDFMIGNHKVRGGLIGSVVTDPDFRGRGLGTQLLIQAEAELQIKGCAFALLWAETPNWYLDRGYGPMGAEHTFLITRDVADSLPALHHVRTMEAGDEQAIHDCYMQHEVRVNRSFEETSALLQCPDMLVLVCMRNDKVVAYACMGRGRDLQGAVHEWGGETHDVMGLLRTFLEVAFPEGRPFETIVDPDTGNEVPVAENILLMAPPNASDLGLRLQSLGVQSMQSMLGLGKILDRNAAAMLLDDVLGDLGSVEVVESSARPFRIVGEAQSAELDDEGLFALLFGVTEVRQDVLNFLRTFGLEGAQLPLEPFAWGLDSI
jgi:GNAT superfamily N-acetyltransferase